MGCIFLLKNLTKEMRSDFSNSEARTFYQYAIDFAISCEICTKDRFCNNVKEQQSFETEIVVR